jgi:SpoIID/LytB domain protein
MLPKEEPLLNVGILTDKKISFELYGDYQAFGFKDTFSGVFAAEVRNNVIVCSNNDTKLEISDEIEFDPSDPISESFLIKDVVIGSGFHWERKEKQRFNHTLKIISEGQNVIATNVIPLESYLASVISSEMSAKSPLELLKAQAVVARSWVLAQNEKANKKGIEKNNSQGFLELEDEIVKWYDNKEHKLFDVCADDHCQRFQGVTKITSEAAREAITQTKGIVLLSEENICDTRYSKCCGGITEFYENVWEPVKHSYMSSVIDYKYEPETFSIDFSDENNARKWITGNPPAFCNTTDEKTLSNILIDYDRETKNFYGWQISYEQKELSELIKDKCGIDFGDILDLVPIERGASARLVKLKIIGTKKELTVGKELEIRRILSDTHLYSSAIIIDKSEEDIPKQFIIKGAGWGHGVGLCQIGAAVMAQKGFQFDAILLHYFTNANLKRIY